MAPTLFLTMSSLPPNLLQNIFNLAAFSDRRNALRLALVCRKSREWAEPILYSTVKLTKGRSVKAFLDTLLTSRRPQSFFVDHVRSLIITQTTHVPSLVQILLACPRIKSVTFWGFQTDDHTASSSIGPRLYISNFQSSSRQQSHHFEFPDDCFETIRPTHLAVSFRAQNRLHHTPDFSRGFFNHVTHLSVLNSYDDWSTWSRFQDLPSLTHLALDFNVARARSSVTPSALQLSSIHYYHRQIANCVRLILQKCQRLRVLVLLMLFTEQPEDTAAQIIATIRLMGEEDSKVFPFNNPVERVDHRLVFVKKAKPFEARVAHSDQEEAMWSSAELIVSKTARLDPGETPMDCDSHVLII